MDKPIQAGQQFAWALYTLRRGCALWIPEPNKELTSQYRQNGVQIGDVGILKADGSFDFVFNVCCSANDPINQYGVPTDFQTLSWNGAKCRTDNIFRPGEPVLSRGAEKWVLGVEGTAPVLGIPVSGGAELSIRSAKSRGAVIFPVNGVDSVDCEDLAVFRNYVERHAVSWYRFINETLGMEVENGAIYFITGFDKTSCWENAVFSNNMGERNCEVIINTGGLPGGDRFRLSDSSLRVAFSSRCSPPDNVRHNQALFIRGFRISMPRKFKALFNRSGVEVTSTYEASLKNVPGKDGSHFPSNHGAPPSPGSEVSTASSWSKISSSVISSSPSNEARSAYAWVDGNTSQELGDFPPSPRLCHPLKVINDYILQTVKARHDVEVVITHDEDWIALVKGETVLGH
ncbi:hypothetical protein L218DRAFT_620663 [Marasmius fiardii PR-910]|nr:hypothetical protein L218DRAFT_620663 [Marasmius fiardii PR-910]